MTISTASMSKLDILTPALEGRNNDILGYQINIDNYTLAIAKIDAEYPDNEDLQLFRQELAERLDNEKQSQLRCRIIRDVIADQIQALQTNNQETP